ETYLQTETGLDAFDRLHRVGPLAERGEAEIPLTARAEACAWRADHVGLGEQLVEELPGAEAGRRLHPDVGRVARTVHGETDRGQSLADDARVVHVEVDRVAHLLLAVGRVHGGGGLLDHVGHAV